jgi:methionine-S-sulfoxide reductase
MNLKTLLLALPILMVIPAYVTATEKAIFAGGCFWCMDSEFAELDGVIDTVVGYIGGSKSNPTYEEVSSGKSGHIEAIQIEYDPKKISYSKLLDIFWSNIDPTDANGQFADRGTQYKPVIYFTSLEQEKSALKSKRELQNSNKYKAPIVVSIEKATEFFPAEKYHQKYYRTNSEHYKRYKIGSGRAAFIKKYKDKEK